MTMVGDGKVSLPTDASTLSNCFKPDNAQREQQPSKACTGRAATSKSMPFSKNIMRTQQHANQKSYTLCAANPPTAVPANKATHVITVQAVIEMFFS